MDAPKPLARWQFVLGKFAGLLGFLALACALPTLMALSLHAGGRVDLGRRPAILLGLLLLGGAFSAVGLYLSSLTAQPVVAAVSAFGALLLLWLANMGTSDPDSPMHLLSLLKHISQRPRLFVGGSFLV